MKGCRLSLLGETWAEVCDRRHTVKGESEFIAKCIESIFRTRLQEEGTVVKWYLSRL